MRSIGRTRDLPFFAPLKQQRPSCSQELLPRRTSRASAEPAVLRRGAGELLSGSKLASFYLCPSDRSFPVDPGPALQTERHPAGVRWNHHIMQRKQQLESVSCRLDTRSRGGI